MYYKGCIKAKDISIGCVSLTWWIQTWRIMLVLSITSTKQEYQISNQKTAAVREFDVHFFCTEIALR
jgi:hypothetical protein